MELSEEEEEEEVGVEDAKGREEPNGERTIGVSELEEENDDEEEEEEGVALLAVVVEEDFIQAGIKDGISPEVVVVVVVVEE